MPNMIVTSFSKVQSIRVRNGISAEPVALRFYIDGRRNYLFFKRIADIFISLMVIVLFLSWFLPIAALIIKLDSRGPVFFIQRRVGRWGKSFSCFKFRTMVVNAHANIEQALEDDIRITRIGLFLRKTNLDEFPQFFNVLFGQMSIVGPRPHMHADCNMFSEVVPGYKLRNVVKPGITGLAQVKGYRGPAKDFASIFHRYQFDAFYVRNASFWLDLRIVRKTAYQTIRQIFLALTGKNKARKKAVRFEQHPKPILTNN
jgi:putative colanic acid biosynthesis UDP-glucose lipid carrier transferase